MVILFLGWFILSIVAGEVGGSREIGYLPAFLLSIFLSPLVGLLIAFNSDKKTTSAPTFSSKSISRAEELEKLNALFEKGVLTKEEFENEKRQILS